MQRFFPNFILAACVFLTVITSYWIIAIVGMISYFLVLLLKANSTYQKESRTPWKVETICTLITTILVLWISLQNYHTNQNLALPYLKQPIVIRFPGEEPANAKETTPFNQVRALVS
ncbi:MAG TPA: hypothetical protein VK184_19840 [Nostocaceae cyanobacterium]|nr:hypothetical protein [Nostocaceae cyanobacterium]